MVRIFHKVKRCTNGDAVKRLANAFGKCANVGFVRLAEQLGRGHRGGDHREVERFTKARPHNSEEVADALHPRTRSFNQTRHHTLAL